MLARPVPGAQGPLTHGAEAGPPAAPGDPSPKTALVASLVLGAILEIYFQVLLSVELLNATAGADAVTRINFHRQFAVLRAYFVLAAAIGWLGHLTILVLWVRRRGTARRALFATSVLAAAAKIILFGAGVQGRIGGLLGAFIVPAAATLAVLPIMARLLPVRQP